MTRYLSLISIYPGFHTVRLFSYSRKTFPIRYLRRPNLQADDRLFKTKNADRG